MTNMIRSNCVNYKKSEFNTTLESNEISSDDLHNRVYPDCKVSSTQENLSSVPKTYFLETVLFILW